MASRFITTSRKRLQSRQQFLSLQLLNLVLFWAFLDDASASWLFLNGILNVGLYGYLAYNEFQCAHIQVEPLFVYLVAGMFRIGLGTCWAAAAYGTGHYEVLKLGPQRVDQFLNQGQACLLIGDWCLVLGWTLWSLRRPTFVAVPTSSLASERLFNQAIALLALGWVLKLLLMLGVPLLSIGNFASLVVEFSGPAAIYLLFLNANGRPRGHAFAQYALFGTALLIELVFAMSSYMKSHTLILVIALGLCGTYQALKRQSAGKPMLTGANLFGGGFLLLFVIFVLFPFSQLRRTDFWANRGTGYRIGVWSAIEKCISSAIPGTPEFAKMHKFPSDGAWTFLQRHADVLPASWACKYCAQSGSIHGKFVLESLTNLVPRVLWPEKPPFLVGAEITAMTGAAKSTNEAKSSTAIGGVAAGLLLNFGWLAIVPGCLLNGLVFAALSQRFMHDIHVNAFATLLYVAIVLDAAMHFENVFDGGIGTYVYWFVVYLPILWLSNQAVQPALSQNKQRSVQEAQA